MSGGVKNSYCLFKILYRKRAGRARKNEVFSDLLTAKAGLLTCQDVRPKRFSMLDKYFMAVCSALLLVSVFFQSERSER